MGSSTTNGAIAGAGVAEQGIAADRSRRSLCIQALEADMFISHDVDENGDLIDADENVGWKLVAGQARTMYARDWPSIVNGVSVWCATGGAKYVIQSDGLP